QFTIRHRTDGGVAITASHNPAQWNALKFFEPSGMYLDSKRMQQLKMLISTGDFNHRSWNEVGTITTDDEAVDLHINAVLKHVDANAIRQRRFRVALDCVNGAGCIAAINLLNHLGCEVIPLHCAPTGEFERDPEPVVENISALMQLVREQNADVGFALDADADRLAVVADGGIALGEEMSLVMAVKHILSRTRGIVVTNLSTSMAVDDIASMYDCQVMRTPVGDINVSKRLKEVKGVIGGEGNGGIIYPPLQYARDGICGMALILEFMAQHEDPLSIIIRDLPHYHMVKRKIRRHQLILPSITECCKQLFGDHADEIIEADGIKFVWYSPRRWVHIRPSGTEVAIRVIAEAEHECDAEHLCATAIEGLQELIQ
ncbi:MAG TPA: phosphoglucosamine mutase, partial [Armatimonadetes bacterium]|nr:phosphoglucosamine mutase [Armatimonadota bacterium]